jgi:hypothetical protein
VTIKTAADFDDTEIMVKFRSLLGKYQNQGKIVGTATRWQSAGNR